MALHANYISICAGGGGLDLAVELAIPSARAVVLVEREAFACAHLVAAMQANALHQAPIWSDVRSFDGRPWRGLVDGLVGGIPCQPHSAAGRKGGQHDERDLWSPTRRIIARARPWFVLIENVGGMLSAGSDEIAGAERVWRDLRKLGYAVEAGLFTAAEVGASHERERIFILGVSLADAECTQRRASSGGGRVSDRDEAGRRQGAGGVGAPGAHVADASSERRSKDAGGASGDEGANAGRPASYDHIAQRSGAAMALAAGEGSQGGEPVDALRPQREDATPERGSDAVARAPGDGQRSRLERDVAAQAEGGRALASSPGREVEEPTHGPGRLHEGQGRPLEGETVDRWAGLSDFPPAPGDGDRWRAIAFHAPDCLPALSRYDRFRLALGKARDAADGDPLGGQGLDAQGPFGLRPALVQEIAKSTLRRVADGMADARVDWLRLLGNGVVPIQAGFAIRTLAKRLSDRGHPHLWTLCQK